MSTRFSKAILPVAVLGGIFGGSYYWWGHRAPTAGSYSLDALTQEAPGRSFFWAGAELRDRLQADQIKQRLNTWRQQNSKAEQTLAEWERSSGQSLEQLLDTYAASAQLALFTRPDREDLMPMGNEPPVEAAFSCHLKDRAPVEAWLKEKRLPSSQDVAYGAFQLSQVGPHAWAALSQDCLYLASSQPGLQVALDAGEKHQQTLAEDPQFQQAWKQIPRLGKGAGGAFYYRLDSTWRTLEKFKGPYIDADTVKSLKGLPYLVGGIYPGDQGWQSELFVALESQGGSPLAQRWLQAPQQELQLASGHPRTWSYFQSLNVFYTFEALIEVARLAPQGRTGSTMALSFLGLQPQGERYRKIHQAFTGEVAWGLDLAGLLKAVPGNFAEARGAGQRTACQSNLKNCATALEMYACDNAGRYPPKMQALTPAYLRSLPTCPSANRYNYGYESKEQPDRFTLTCQGNHHGLGEGLPQYTAEQGLIAPPAEPPRQEPTSPRLQGVVSLGVKDAALAQELLEELVSRAPRKPESLSLDGHPAMRLGGGRQPIYWTFVDKPAALVLSLGPAAEDSLKLAIQVSQGKQPSLADNAQALAFARAHQKGAVAWHSLDLQAVLEALPAAAGVSDLKGLMPSPDLGALQVETGGLRYTNRGVAGWLGSSLGLALPVAIPNFLKARGRGQLTACKSNQKNLATALEMWSSDHSGRYPAGLSELTPLYLPKIPHCPAAGRDTYSESYTSGTSPDRFRFFCQGHHHRSTEANYPQYDSHQGLLERP